MMNIDYESGRHFGVIPTNLLRESFYDCSTNIQETRIRNQIKRRLNEIKNIMEKHGTYPSVDVTRCMCELLENATNETWENREDDMYVFNCNGIKLKATINGDYALIVKSPFITTCELCPQGCSPRYVNAGNLSRPTFIVGYETYCLPNDWFENGEAPYEYWEIEE